MSGNHPERCLSPEQPSTPTQNVQSKSINNLPSEILTKIIEQMLPEDIPSTYDADRESYPEGCMSIRLGFIHPRPRPQERVIGYHYAVLYTNKRLHSVTLRILQARIFRIKIGEEALTSTNAADRNIKWVWDPVFPGLDLSNVCELVVQITPTNVWLFWTMVTAALKSLCDQQLLLRGPLKRLRIELKDTDKSNYWCLGTLISGESELRWTHVTAQDYENVLELFKEVVSSVAHCDICLPYWMERSSATKRIVEEWAKPSVQIWVMGPADRKVQEVRGGGWGELVPLPDSLLP